MIGRVDAGELRRLAHAVADLVVLGPEFDVRHTIVGGRMVYTKP